MPYQPLDHTADLGLELTGATLSELLTDAAHGLVASTVAVEAIVERLSHRIEVEADTPDILLHDVLDELLFLLETDGLVLPYGELEATATDSGWRAAGELRGELFDRARHPQFVQIKAVTYHGLDATETSDGWRGRVIFDI